MTGYVVVLAPIRFETLGICATKLNALQILGMVIP